MNYRTLRLLAPALHRHAAAALIALALGSGPAAAQTVDITFNSPATNSAPGATFIGSFNFGPFPGASITGFVVSGTAIVPQSNFTITGGGSNRNVNLAPLPDQSGTVTAMLESVFSGSTASAPFVVVFRPYPPVIGPVANRTIPEDGSTNVPFTVSDPDTPVGDLTVTATSSNTNLVNAVLGGSGSNRTVLLTPFAHINGTSTITITVSDGIYITNRIFTLSVTPVPDPSTISGLVNRAFGDDVGTTNIFSGIQINDVDHNMPLPEQLVATATLSSDEFATFQNGLAVFAYTGLPAQVTTAMNNAALVPLRYRAIPGTINNVGATMRVRGVADNITVTSIINLAITVINSPPTFDVSLSPTSVVEGASVQPFTIDFIYDPDVGENLFTIGIEFVNTNQQSLIKIMPTNRLEDTALGLSTDIQNLTVLGSTGILVTASEQIPLRFTLMDGYGGTSVVTNVFTLIQAQNPPQISGVPAQTINKTDADPAFIVYPTVFVQDPDQGGLQPVSATLSQSLPAIGSLSVTSLPFMTPAQLSTALQAVAYTPTPGALPVGAVDESTIALTVTDFAGLKASNTAVKVRITSVNLAPQILNVPPTDQQPVLIPPTPPLRPFAGLGLSNDDPNNIVFTIVIDNAGKGSLTNLGGFVQNPPGTYVMTGSVAGVLGALTNIQYVLNPGHAFPPDDPGGTTFTLSARDFELLTTIRTLAIQIQEAPRNHLVVRALNDGLPGSFNYALANAGNNDVITFALPSYPAIIRMPGASADTLTRAVSIKGPGANLLTISGDNNGDFIANRQLFRVRSRVTIEGVTLAYGTAAFGGAILVESNGVLTLRQVAIVDSFASQYGGAIDVDGGRLTLEGCFIGRNRLSPDTGMSGAGVSVYSDKEIQIINTTFAGNVQPNNSGDGGGALVIQNRTPSTPLNAHVVHCTFIDSEDDSGRASALFSVEFGTFVRPWNSIFADFSGRNLEVAGAGNIISKGGNICDDSTRTDNLQGGESSNVFLLAHSSDLTETDPLLAPLNLNGDPTPFAEPLSGSPAIGIANGAAVHADQRGVKREGVADAGAIEYAARGRVVINEIHFDDNQVNFIELLVRRDSTPVDLGGYSLLIDGKKVHNFSDGTIVGTNELFDAGDPAPTVINPGFGYVIAFTNTPIALTSALNPTPVARPSVTNAPLNLNYRGIIEIGTTTSMQPLARQAYLGDYLDPASGTNLLNTAGNSIALAPQYRGFALVPHGLILPGPFDGVDMSRDLTINPFSPGADVLGTPFGQDNAEPLAVPDIFTVTEDDLSTLLVLANDYDGDGNDRLVIVDVSAGSEPGVGDASATNSALGASVAVDPDAVPLKGLNILYDPRATLALQQLPVGVETIDSFYYESIDYGFAPVEGYSDGGGFTIIAATSHRLTNDAEIVISGAVPLAYNGTHAVTVVDENSFSIAVAFAGAGVSNGTWETVLPRAPTARSEASVSVRVVGVNDPPVANLDVITNVNERSLVRLMIRPEQAGSALTFPGDPVPPPVMLDQDVLSNDDDIDADDTWSSLRVIGVMGAVNEIAGYGGTPGEQPVVVTSPGHGLATGQEILIANYGGHPSYNGYSVVTVLDADTFTIPRFFVDDAPDKGVWVILNDDNRYAATTDVGALVALTLRADPEEDHILYDAFASAFLQGLAEGEQHTNRFFYAVVDSHGAIGIGPIDVIVDGVNNTPLAPPDPDSLGVLGPLVNASNTLADVLADGLDLMYLLPPASGTPERTDLHVLDLSGALPGTLVLADFFVTDEDTPLDIDTADLLANDTDVDRNDVLTVLSVDAASREGAAISLNLGVITYNPTVSTSLQALAREELRIDTFEAVVTDGNTGGTVTSLVAVLVIGMNDTPVANPVLLVTHEDQNLAFDPRANDIERDINGVIPDDRLRIIAVTNLPNPGQARVDMTGTNVTHDATVSALLNALDDTQSFTNIFNYSITDNSFLFAVDDEFHVPAGTVNKALDVLANDRDFTDSAGELTIIGAGPTLNGGTVVISTNGQYLIYSSPPAFVGDDHFRYVIQNDKGDINAGRVLVRSVVPSINGILQAANDRFAVAAGETAVMNVRANDNTLPMNGSGLTITALLSSSEPGQPILTNNTFVYTATNGLAPLTFRYEVSGGGTSRAEADAILYIVERRGSLQIQDDAYSVPPNSIGNVLEVLVNDNLVTESQAALRIREVLAPPVNGTLTTNGGATQFAYTPNPGFIGVEQFQYIATDQIGGTGTGTVTITVGRIDIGADFFKIHANTNLAPVLLDVLANDRVMPNGTGSLSIVSVNPSSSAIGTLTVASGGTRLQFVASNVLGQLDFDYIVQDGGSPARLATGRVNIATVPNGAYANPDRYLVRGGGADYEFDVLANDISYPTAGKTYTIQSIGVGPNAPNQGGTATIEDNKIRYTPAPGFFGEESFTYTMSDSIQTDVAQVNVTVRRGDLVASRDAYAVFFELAPGTNIAVSFTLPVTLNDRILPDLGQVLEISALGAGTNAPSQGGSVQIAGNKQELIYRPVLVPVSNYVEQFTYEISDGGDRRASTTVRVKVSNRASNLVAVTQNDAFSVLRDSVSNVLPVLANDFVLPGTAAGWKITGVSASLQGAAISFTNAILRYTPPAGFVGEDVFTYTATDGLGGTGSAEVRVRVGSLPTMPDLFVVLSGTANNELDVAANDPLVAAYAVEYELHSVFGASAGGTIAVSPDNTVFYTPSGAYTGAYPYTETFFYRIADDASGLVTGTARVIVHDADSDRATSTITLIVEGRNDPPAIVNPATILNITDKQSVKPFLLVTFTEVDMQGNEPLDITVSIDDSAKGVLRNLLEFEEIAPGQLSLTNVTAAVATARIRELIFEPVENRIPVPTSELTVFTITATDNKSPPVVNTNSRVNVLSVNDAPTITGTRSNQAVYGATPIKLFSSVTITEVDNLGLQPLVVTINMAAPTNGAITNLGAFAQIATGVYRATNITADAASTALRSMWFITATNLVSPGAPLVTTFTLSVDDGFAAPVVDGATSVITYDAFEGSLRPTNVNLRGLFGWSVDTIDDFAVVGAPEANANGTNSGVAFVYRRVPGPSTTNSWELWRTLLPPTIGTNHQLGRSVAITTNTIAVGAVNDGFTGAVYIFDRNQGGPDNWGQIVRLTPIIITNAAQFGYSVDLDGDTLIVGAPRAATGTTQSGRAFIYGRNQGGSNAWGLITNRVPTGGGITNAEFGWSVAISGERALVGAPRADINNAPAIREGAVFYLARDAGGPDNWGIVQRVDSVQTNITGDFGWDVSLDGNLAVIGAPSMTVGSVSNAGIVFVHQWNAASNMWMELSRIDRQGDNERRFGQSVAVQGNRFFAGAPDNDAPQNIGAAYLYRRNSAMSTNWTLVNKFMRPPGSPAGRYGWSVGLSPLTGIVGALTDLIEGNNRGYVFMYRLAHNNPPYLVAPIVDPLALVATPFHFPIPALTFADPDFDDELTITASFPADTNGLNFVSMAVTGTPVSIGLTPVNIAAADRLGLTATGGFRVIVLDGVTLTGTPRDLWDLDQFGNAVTNPALEGPLWGGNANPDGDAKNNDQEYAFGGDPNAPDSRSLTIGPGPSGTLQITYTRRTTDPSLTFLLQGSTNLIAWVNLSLSIVSETATDIGNGIELVTLLLNSSTPLPYQHYRVLVLY